MTFGEREMRALFLDFDGVLHPVSALRCFEMRLPVETAIGRGRLFRWSWVLADLLEPHPDVQIIVHSSWRLLHRQSALPKFMGPLGNRFAGSTTGDERWEGITQVVVQNRLSDFRVLDDHPEHFPAGLSELIVCDSELGVYDETVRNHLRAWLG
jgi:hypothetical protein